MAKFIYGAELNHELIKLVKEASLELTLISPFIKLHQRVKDELNKKRNDPNFKLTICFGKNEKDVQKSLSIEELEYFKSFNTVSIYYEPRLHAKFYANGLGGIITSLNLYDYSVNNNIESGVYFSSSSSIYTNSYDYFMSVASNSELIYKSEAVFERSLGGLVKKFKEVVVVEDNTDKYYQNQAVSERKPKYQKEEKPNIVEQQDIMGYCIRSGERIPFNPSAPLSAKAYESWKKFANPDYKEKYCHFSGEESGGETSFSKPILKKNWSKARTFIKK